MKIFIFDFDLTLTTCHIYNEYFIKRNKDIINNKNIFRKIILNNFEKFVTYQLFNNNKIFICSLNDHNIIELCLRNILPEELIKKISIITPHTYSMNVSEVLDKKRKGINMKQIFVKSLIDLYSISPKDIYFYDDDMDNVEDIKLLGVNCTHVNKDNDLNIN